MGDEEEVAPPSSAPPEPVPRDFSGESWRLKLVRAKYHLDDLERRIAAHGDRRPYEARRRLQTKKDRNVWRYHLAITEPLDWEIHAVLGDAIHNIRSALDHIAVAISSKDDDRSPGFPIERENVWGKQGRFYLRRKRSDVEARARFKGRTKGMLRAARAYIHSLQPYQLDPPQSNALAILNSLENADKHRKLIHLTFGLMNPLVEMETERWAGRAQLEGLAEHDAKLVEIPPPPGVPADAKVKVTVSGTPMVSVDIQLQGRRGDIVTTLRTVIAHLETLIFPKLERFVM